LYLENETHAQLQTAAGVGRIDNAKARRAENVAGQTEVRMVEGVDRFETKLQPLIFRDRDVLEQREVKEDISVAAQKAAPRRSESSCCRLGERSGIEPSFNRARSGCNHWIADQTWALCSGGEGICIVT